jgi:hypothetical protein
MISIECETAYFYDYRISVYSKSLFWPIPNQTLNDGKDRATAPDRRHRTKHRNPSASSPRVLESLDTLFKRY